MNYLEKNKIDIDNLKKDNKGLIKKQQINIKNTVKV